MTLETLVATCGYLAVLVGTFLEGEAIRVIAGFLAHRGYLELPWVIAAAFAGTFAGDQLYFQIGRSRGQAFLGRRPGLKSRTQRLLDSLVRHQVLLIPGFRFVHGIRTVTPLVPGASGVAPACYFALNFLGALARAAAFGTAGYYFGHALEVLLGEVRQYERWIVGAMFAVSVAGWGWFRWRGRLDRRCARMTGKLLSGGRRSPWRSMLNKRLTLLVFPALAILATGAALAAPPEGKGKPQANPGHKHGPPDVSVALPVAGLTFTAARQLAVSIRYTGMKPLPPGIRKNLARGKPLPPGIAKQAVPAGMLAQLPVHAGHEWRVCGSDLVLVALAGAVVADVLFDVFN